MKRNRLFTAMLSAAMAVSCAVEPIPDLTETSGQEQTLTIQAVLDDSSDATETKTVRNEDGSVSWQTGDRISLFFGSGSNGGSAFTTTDSGKTASFTGTIEAFTAGGEDFDGGMVYFWGLYPYDAAATCNNTSVTTNIPSTQRGMAGTFSPGQHMTLARSENLLMSFKSVCSGLRFSLQTEGVESAVFHPIGDEAVVGDITVSMADGLPVVTSMRNTSSEITLIPDGGAFEVGKDYYFEFAPFTAASGFEVTLYKGNQQATFTFSTSRTFARNKYTWKTNLDEGLEWTVGSGPEYANHYIDEYGVDRGAGIEIVENINGVNTTVVWAPVNLGYSEIYPYGKLYQWGRKYGQGYGPTNANDEAGIFVPVLNSPAANRRPVSNPDAATFYTYVNITTHDWYASLESEQFSYDWNSINQTEYIGNPCPEGWRVPTSPELSGLKANKSGWTMKDGLKGYYYKGNDGGIPDESSVFLPAAGYRYNGSGNSAERDWSGWYWSAYPNGKYADYLYFKDTDSNMYTDRRADGISIRCVRGDTYNNGSNATPINLSTIESANSYLISSPGRYRFNTVKGNSGEAISGINSVSVIWESFGTDEIPVAGDIIKSVEYYNGFVTINTPNILKDGNALVAVKDASGTILWSWHIWVCDGYDPESTAQEYYNNGGAFMDRNLGATSATPGDVKAWGLQYEWGRKDPFLPGLLIEQQQSKYVVSYAASTYIWPSSKLKGTIEYSIQKPTVYLESNSADDWGNWTSDNYFGLWAEEKTVYDPCPPGWQVPRASSFRRYFNGYQIPATAYSINGGYNMHGVFGDSPVIYFPFVRHMGVYWSMPSTYASYWTVHSTGDLAEIFSIDERFFWSYDDTYHSTRSLVRCQKQ